MTENNFDFLNNDLNTTEKHEAPVVEEAHVEPEVAPEPSVNENLVVIDQAAEEVTPDLAPNHENTIGSNAPKDVKPATKEDKKLSANTVAIHSTKNVSWEGVGEVKTGYNIVSKKEADMWLKRNHTRLATPEEVAKEFGL